MAVSGTSSGSRPAEGWGATGRRLVVISPVAIKWRLVSALREAANMLTLDEVCTVVIPYSYPRSTDI
jgi:hypothetical protein